MKAKRSGYKSSKFLSPRGFELFCDGVCDRPVITVENYMKWYDLFAIHPNGQVTVVDGREFEHGFYTEYDQSAYGDHIFNPYFVLYLAGKLGMDVCLPALEVIIGRWEIEHNDFPREQLI